ncbi:superoxide dismutase family protein [Candidatus Poribacteria bacterium]|nr:superoxide dismutase family protein [Candidatus Poribacteria bacterium]
MKTNFNPISIKFTFLIFISIVVILSGCERAPQQAAVLTPATPIQANAVIGSLGDSGVTGTAVFTQNDDMITLIIEVMGASPGLHGVHIHEKGDCSAPDGSSAGGHWNPTNVDHGKWGVGEFHLGDIGNINVGEDGSGSISLTTDLWEIGTGSDVDVVGKGIIVHADPDDFISQPSGNAGARIGCGVIVLTE